MNITHPLDVIENQEKEKKSRWKENFKLSKEIIIFFLFFLAFAWTQVSANQDRSI